MMSASDRSTSLTGVPIRWPRWAIQRWTSLQFGAKSVQSRPLKAASKGAPGAAIDGLSEDLIGRMTRYCSVLPRPQQTRSAHGSFNGSS